MDNLSDQFEISGAESSEHDGKWDPKFDCESSDKRWHMGAHVGTFLARKDLLYPHIVGLVKVCKSKTTLLICQIIPGRGSGSLMSQR